MGWVLLGLLSAAPSILPGLSESLAPWLPEGASFYGLALLPWLALGGLPISSKGLDSKSWGFARTLFPLAAALPALGLAAGLDLAQGRLELSWSGGLVFLLGGPLLILLWRLSAVAGLAGSAAARVHGLVWGLFLPLSAAAVCALVWAPPPMGDQPAFDAAWLGFLNPLMWCWELTGHDAEFVSLGAQLGRLAILLGCAGLSWGLAASLARRDRA